MFMAFRFILIFFAIVQLILAVFALISGYSTNFLSKFYLLDVNVQQAKLAALINTASYINQKRDNIGAFGQNPTQAAAAVPSTTAATQNAPVPAATENENTVATIATAAAANSVATATTAAAAAVGTTPGTAANLATVGNPSVAAPNPATVNTGTGTTSAPTGFVTVTVAGSLQVTPASAVAAASTVYAAGSLQATVNQLVGLTAAQIGLADVYSFSLWGYCRGTSTSENLVIVNGVASTSFDNANVNFTWCSPPKAAYYFDPTQFLTTEINNAISNNPSITAQTKADLQAFLQTLSNDHITLPGNLSKQLGMIKSMSQASFGLILAVIAMVFFQSLLIYSDVVYPQVTVVFLLLISFMK